MRKPVLATLAVITASLLAGCGTLPSPSDQGSVQSPVVPAPSPGVAVNGIESLSAKEALSQARTAFVGAPGVHVVVTSTDKKTAVDIQLQGKDRARVSLTSEGRNAKVIVVGSKVYINTADLKDQWAKATTSDKQFTQFAPLVDREEVFKTFVGAAFTSAMKVSQGGAINGHHSVKLAAGTTEIYLAADGDPYPLRVVEKGSAGGKVDFTGYGAKASIAEPPAAKVIAG